MSKKYIVSASIVLLALFFLFVAQKKISKISQKGLLSQKYGNTNIHSINLQRFLQDCIKKTNLGISKNSEWTASKDQINLFVAHYCNCSKNNLEAVILQGSNGDSQDLTLNSITSSQAYIDRDIKCTKNAMFNSVPPEQQELLKKSIESNP